MNHPTADATDVAAEQAKEIAVQKFKAYRTFEDNKVISSRFVDMTIDELDPGEVVVKTKYSTINYKDALSYNGTGKIMRKYPTVAGIDMAGTVETSTDPRWKKATRSSCTPTTWAWRTTAATPSTCACRPTGSCAGPRA